MPYRSISPEAVVATIDRLERRIAERFDKRGLQGVCAELGAVARRASERILILSRPNLWVRTGVGALLACGVIAFGFLLREVKLPFLREALLRSISEESLLSLFSGIEAAVNVVVLLGVGLFFLLRHEERSKRQLALSDLHEIRALAHVIDMHQLTKDPTMMAAGATRTAASPKDELSAFELVRYLDYCSEMLSLAAKVAALYAEHLRDPVVMETVSDIESMTTNLSRKIWQKISILEGSAGASAPSL